MRRDDAISKVFVIRLDSTYLEDREFSGRAYNYLSDVEDFLEEERELLKVIMNKLTSLTNIRDVKEVIEDIEELL